MGKPKKIKLREILQNSIIQDCQGQKGQGNVIDLREVRNTSTNGSVVYTRLYSFTEEGYQWKS